MQKVAWPTTIVHSDRLSPLKAKKAFRAMPVMIPGSASGSTTTNETTSRPKKRKRCTAKAAAEPSSRAMAVAASHALMDSSSELRTSGLRQVSGNHLSDRLVIGQLWMFEGLNA